MSTSYPATLILKSARAAEELGTLVDAHPRFHTRAAKGDPAGLVILELDGAAGGLDRAERLVAEGRAAEVFVTSTVKDPDLIIAAMRAGVSEFLAWPLEPKDLAAALDRFTARRGKAPETRAPSGPKGRLVHVLGVKGGVGATTLAVNLAAEVRRAAPDRGVALVDAALPLGEIPLFLDLDYAYTWAEAVRDTSRLDATFMEGLMVRHASGLDVLCAPDHIEDAASLRPDGLAAALKLLRTMYPLVVVDGSPYLDDLSLAAVREADEVLLVTELSLPGLSVVRRLLESFANLDQGLSDKVRLVVSRHQARGGIDPAEAEKLLGVPVFHKIANDYPGTLEAVNQGAPLFQAAPKSPAAKDIAALAARYARGCEAKERSGLLARFLTRRKTGQNAEAGAALSSGLAAQAGS
ncbi:AAA family ATPase [Desulfocurvus sp. DL9XJH121]